MRLETTTEAQNSRILSTNAKAVGRTERDGRIEFAEYAAMAGKVRLVIDMRHH
jgi:hypothetical protein